jgi:hypothetical protein
MLLSASYAHVVVAVAVVLLSARGVVAGCRGDWHVAALVLRSLAYPPTKPISHVTPNATL